MPDCLSWIYAMPVWRRSDQKWRCCYIPFPPEKRLWFSTTRIHPPPTHTHTLPPHRKNWYSGCRKNYYKAVAKLTREWSFPLPLPGKNDWFPLVEFPPKTKWLFRVVPLNFLFSPTEIVGETDVIWPPGKVAISLGKMVPKVCRTVYIEKLTERDFHYRV